MDILKGSCNLYFHRKHQNFGPFGEGNGVRSFGLWIVGIDRDSSSLEPKAMIKAVTFSDAVLVTPALLPNSMECGCHPPRLEDLEWRQAPRRDPTAGSSGLKEFFFFQWYRKCFKLTRNVRSDA